MSGNQHNRSLQDLGNIVVNHYNKKVFSSLSLAFQAPFLFAGEESTLCWGKTGFDSDENVTPSTLFDLASLTKPLVTALCILFLIDQKKLAWDDLLGSLFDRAIPYPLGGIDVYSLLNHSSGLAAHRNYWMDAIGEDEEKRRKWLLDELLAEKVAYGKGSRHVYSDLGYILLGFIVEKITAMRLDRFWTEIVAEPLGIEKELFFPGTLCGMDKDMKDYPHTFAATGVCVWSGDVLKGVVHDDNCRAVGGICGHAGLFGSASAVLVLCREMLDLYKGRPSRLPVEKDLFRAACKRADRSDWTAGFTVPSIQASSAGAFFSPDSIGHLGFTGTSFWIDLRRELIVVLLTNRVLAGDDQQGIKALRPEVHNYLAGHRGRDTG